ncbi:MULTISPECIES: hypothetical protein [unclassified Cupriavidus]|uniref:hypothetical protein n=1 Tax=unclassified Cupriavidus TaxID=2640874 RepID=UPI0010F81597|nr:MULTISPECIES: hypothetical protein [unclassified Cupriavidus]MWL85997.1 hypothetical protein [Cupriavidus sp. SW-Y-13]
MQNGSIRIKHCAAVGLCTIAMTLQTTAQASTTTRPTPITTEDIEYLTTMLPDRPPHLESIDTSEMDEVRGRFGPVGAAIGAITGAAGYFGEAIVSGQGSTQGLLIATGVGAATGFIMGPAGNLGANAILGGTMGFYGGMATGLLGRGCSGCHADYSKKSKNTFPSLIKASTPNAVTNVAIP